MTERTELRHIPALDGLRGLGVLGILLFHAGSLRGGWLGVDLFFVLSGFLITSLLLAEFRRTGQVRIGAFWIRRARRLLPALFGLLAAVGVFAATFAGLEELSRLRADALATLGYVANWHAIAVGSEYWELFRAPSPLDHTWSLAIEEQFYLLWPPLAYAVLVRSTSPTASLRGVAIGGALASAAWMAWLFDPLDGTARVYFGSDTRAFATLCGAALALTLEPEVARPPQRASPLWGWTSVAALGVLTLAWCTLRGDEPTLYRGGLLGLALLASVLIAGVIRAPEGPAARLLGIRPLRGLGRVSYGTYLWHWPLYLVLSPERTGLEGPALLALRVAASVGAGAISYLGIERPVRRLRRGAWGVAGGMGLAGAAIAGGILVATSVPAPVGAGKILIGDQVVEMSPDLLLVGDSVAYAIGPAFVEEASRRGLRVDPLGIPGCMLLRSNRMRTPEGQVVKLDACAEKQAEWHERALWTRPRVVLIFDGWPGLGDRLVGSTWAHPCEPAYDAAYAADLFAAVRSFQSTAREVVLVTPPPAALEDEPAYLTAQFRTRMDCQNRARRQVALRTGARLFDLEQRMCPDGKCPPTIQGKSLRRDGIHFTETGGRSVAGWVFDDLAPLLTPDPSP